MYAGLLAAGLDGIDNTMDPGEPNSDNLFTLPPAEIEARGIKKMPPTHAAENLADDECFAAGLGMTADGPYRDYFVQTKSDEFMAHHHEVTPGEVNRYLTLF